MPRDNSGNELVWDSDVDLGGWRIAASFAAGPDTTHFHAIYGGDAFGQPERGIVAVLACAHPPVAAERRANDAAQLVVHSFVEGYFGARRTIGKRRAAAHALHSINGWLQGQIATDLCHRLAPVSLSALIFADGRLGIVHVGAGRLYRRRGGQITPLLRGHLRPAADGGVPSRAVGLDAELSVDFSEEPVQPGDVLLLVSGDDMETPVEIEAALAGPAEAMAVAMPEQALLRLDIEVVPAPGGAGPTDLTKLKLRPAPREGDAWDGFVLGKTLYQGRYTMVKAAHDTLENRDVALKIPLPAMLQDEIFAAGFMREAWIGSTVRGPNVARYIELPAERRSSLYLVMPLYAGQTLEARLHQAPPVSLPDGVGIALKLCEAVQDLAAIEIVHRDIKPDNIMLLDHNKIKLLDLGLAYLPGIDQADAVKPGGTLRYMAPELLSPGQAVQANARSEVYALAVTIYRMFAAGAYPFGQRESVPLARLRPDLPSWLGRILGRALAADPKARFADAGAMALALHGALVSGAADRAPRPEISRLQIWQVAAAIFAFGFFILLLRALR